jgi:hypothetical protein
MKNFVKAAGLCLALLTIGCAAGAGPDVGSPSSSSSDAVENPAREPSRQHTGKMAMETCGGINLSGYHDVTITRVDADRYVVSIGGDAICDGDYEQVTSIGIPHSKADDAPFDPGAGDSTTQSTDGTPLPAAHSTDGTPLPAVH